MVLKLYNVLKAKGLTVSFAESCTGGLLSANFAALPGISEVYQGSIVSYSYGAKSDLLQVDPDLIQRDGAVSEQVAAQMAKGVKKKLKSQCSVAITGIAGPSGGTPEKPVGTVWFAVSGPGFDKASKKFFNGSRTEIQRQSAEYAVEFLLENLEASSQ